MHTGGHVITLAICRWRWGDILKLCRSACCQIPAHGIEVACALAQLELIGSAVGASSALCVLRLKARQGLVCACAACRAGPADGVVVICARLANVKPGRARGTALTHGIEEGCALSQLAVRAGAGGAVGAHAIACLCGRNGLKRLAGNARRVALALPVAGCGERNNLKLVVCALLDLLAHAV